MVDMSVKIGNVTLKNPIMPASGAFSTDLAQVMDINRLGALVAKTVSREFRIGNPPPRVAELECGMINSIGLPTKGIEYFLSHQVPDYKRFTPPLVASISAQTAEDFEAMTRDVDVPDVDIIEVNISCPTRNPGGGNFAMHEDHTYKVMTGIRAQTKKPVWAKLSPNAGDVVAIAKAAEAAGADALVVSNTILGLEDQRRHLPPGDRQQVRRHLRAGRQADHHAHGLSMRQGGEDPDHRLRRHRQGRGRRRVHAGRRQRGDDGLHHLPQSVRHDRDPRRPRGMVPQARLRPRLRPHRRDDRRSPDGDLRRRGGADRGLRSSKTTARMKLTIRKPDDWHLHVRDGAMLKAVMPFTARHFGRAILMPNLVPPVMTTKDAIAYRERALAARPPGSTFTPLMTCYLRDDTDPDDVERGFREGVFTGVKLYPANATTNSAAGVTDLKQVTRVLERMEKIDMPFLMHGEVVDPTSTFSTARQCSSSASSSR